MASSIPSVDACVYCLEDPQWVPLFRRCLPNNKVVDWNSFLQSHSKHPEVEETSRRESQLAAWLPDELSGEIPSILHTLEMLRSALVLGATDVEFAFSLLSETPKNKLLKHLMERYVDSPLTADWVERVWKTIHDVKTESQPPSPIVFVPARESSYLFEEFAKSFSAGRIMESWEFNEKSRQALWFVANPSDALDRMADRAQVLLRRNPSSPVVMAIECQPRWRLYLKFRLSRLGLKVEDHTLSEESAANEVEALLTKIRLRRDLPLKKRLETLHRIQEITKRRPQVEITEVLRQLELSEEPEEVKERSVANIPPTDHRQISQVYLLPFHGVSLPSMNFLAYADSTLYVPPPENVWLTDTEKDVLFESGFKLSSHRARRERLEKQFQALRNSGVSIFSDGSLSTPEGFREVPIQRTPLSAPPSVPNSYVPSFSIRRLSATQLEAYARCPARYFFQNRMKLGKIDWDRTYPLLFGQAVHTTLENYWKSYTEIPEPSVLRELFLQALTELDPSVPPQTALHALMTSHFERFVDSIATIESHIRELGEFQPIAHEEAFEIDLEGVRFIGKIDRVDRSPSDELLVIDYKTGNVTFSPVHVEKGTNFQSILYLWAAEQKWKKPVAGMAFYDLKAGEFRRGLFRKESFPPQSHKSFTRGHVLTPEKWEDLQRAGMEQLRQIVAKMKTGDFAPLPDSQHCGNCDFAGHCHQAEGYR